MMCMLMTAYFEVGLAATLEARSFIELQGGLLLRARRQHDFVAVRLPRNIERMSKNPLAESQPAIVGAGDDILDHSVRSCASREVGHDRERARRHKQIFRLRHDQGHEAGCKQ